MEYAVLSAILAASAFLSVGLAAWYLAGGGRVVSFDRRVATYVKDHRSRSRDGEFGFDRQARVARRAAGFESSNVLIRSIERLALAGKVDLTGAELLIIGAGLGVLLAVAVALGTRLWPLSLLALLFGICLPIIWLRLRIRRLARRFHAQLADTVTLMASAVRAGNALPRAFERVAVEAPEPTRDAFGTAVREMGLGAPLEEALERIATRFPSEEMDLLVASMNVQYQLGGNLTKVLDLIADTLHERIRIEGEIASLTSSQRYSAYLLSSLPVVVTVFLLLVSPGYVGILFQGAFRVIPVIAATLVIVGFVAMRQLAKVDV